MVSFDRKRARHEYVVIWKKSSTGFGALAALKRKRKKFSKSRNTSPILEPAATPQISKSQKILNRASSVPTRHDETNSGAAIETTIPSASTSAAANATASAAPAQPSTCVVSTISSTAASASSARQPYVALSSPQRAAATIIQMPSDTFAASLPSTSIVRSISGLTPSTTDESVKCSTSTSPPSSSTNTTAAGLHVMSVDRRSPPSPLPSSSSSAGGGGGGGHQSRTGRPLSTTASESVGQLPHLPNITPLRGHTGSYQGWL